MRIAIISDIHGNIEALTEVMKAIEALSPDRIICLGDVVGYGASPDACCDIIREVAEVTLLGNHDAAVSGRMDYSFYYDAARKAIDWSIASLSAKNMRWLKSLPLTYRLGEVGFSHGSPVDPRAYNYIFALAQAQELTPFLQVLPSATFIGHSHLCKIFALGKRGVTEVESNFVKFRRGHQYILSVGSVGQPRDYDNRACFVLYDSKAKTIEYQRVDYDIRSAARRILDAKLATNFAKRLFHGI